MKSKQTWSLAEGYCQFEAKFRTLMIEETLSAKNFRFVAKIQRKSVLCSNEMSLNRPRTFDERSLEQITKFTEFRLHYFCTILYDSNESLKLKTSGCKNFHKPLYRKHVNNWIYNFPFSLIHLIVIKLSNKKAKTKEEKAKWELINIHYYPLTFVPSSWTIVTIFTEKKN